MKIFPTTACYPGLNHYQVADALLDLKHKDYNISFDYLQICPQTLKPLEIQYIKNYNSYYPNAVFRLHANLRLLEKCTEFNAGHIDENYKKKLKQIIKLINKDFKTDAYTYHAGYQYVSLDKMIDNTLRLQDNLKIKVGIEGLYPDTENSFGMSNVKDYEEIMKKDVYYAIDLSHLNILQEFFKQDLYSISHTLVTHPNCIEVHISSNDGIHDKHQPVEKMEWWEPILKDIKCPIFYESNQLKNKLAYKN